MKNRLVWPSALALAVLVASPIETKALTNGCIVITTRTASDALWRQISSSTLWDADDFMGPGTISPGDAAMQALLQDYGYITRVIPEWLLRPEAVDPCGVYSGLTPQYWYGGGGGPTKPNDTNANLDRKSTRLNSSHVS